MYCRSKYNLTGEFGLCEKANFKTFFCIVPILVYVLLKQVQFDSEIQPLCRSKRGWKHFSYQSFRRRPLQQFGLELHLTWKKVCFIDQVRPWSGIPFQKKASQRNMQQARFFGLFERLLAPVYNTVCTIYLRISASPK